VCFWSFTFLYEAFIVSNISYTFDFSIYILCLQTFTF
jgi:hypothetical protein